MTALRHRPEVDGLRALAVLPVVLYHAGLSFPGGYVGVDVFFVISGFLITSLVLKRGGDFSLTDFWERRVRRIMPALTVMLAVSVIGAWLLLFPDDLIRFGRSLAAQSLLLANVFFWRDSGYFEEGTVRPLLHTWSLAVEEQFYLLFPFVLLAVRKWPIRRVFGLFTLGAILSFAVSAYAVHRYPMPAFYLLPPRAWELLLGAMLAAMPPSLLTRGWLSELLGAGGIVAILLASFLYTASIDFPGPAALLPCLGAAAVILGNTAELTWGGKLLSLSPLVFIGQISYSLYLWHWPVFTAAKYLYAPLTRRDYLGLVLLSVLLAAASWKWVEGPVRNRQILGGRGALFAGAVAATASLLLIGAGFGVSKGAPQRWPSATLRYLEGKSDSDFRIELTLADARRARWFAIGEPQAQGPVQVLVWGDSHAMVVLHVVDQMCRQHGVRCMAATHSSSVPLLGIAGESRYSLRQDADEYARHVIDYVAREHVKHVILAGFWAAYELPEERFRSVATATAQALNQTGAQAYFLKDVPYPRFNVPTALALAAAHGRDVSTLGVTRQEHLQWNASVDATFASLAGPRLHVLDPLPAFVGAGDRCRVALNGRALYFDDHHLSTFGSMQLQPLLEPLFADTPRVAAPPVQNVASAAPR